MGGIECGQRWIVDLILLHANIPTAEMAPTQTSVLLPSRYLIEVKTFHNLKCCTKANSFTPFTADFGDLFDILLGF